MTKWWESPRTVWYTPEAFRILRRMLDVPIVYRNWGNPEVRRAVR